MKFLISSAFVTAALAAPRHLALNQLLPSSPLDVKIQMNGNSQIKAILTNTGDEPLRLLKVGTLLDESPVEKAKVHINKLNSRDIVKFNGIRLRIAMSQLDDSSFRILGAGQSISTDFDLAHAHDLSESGVYHIELSGSLPVASSSFTPRSSSSSSTMLAGSVPYQSNRLTITVDGAAATRSAARAAASSLQRRAQIQDCQGEQLAVTQQALADCARVAQAAANAAVSGPDDKMVEYFKAADDDTRCTVSAVFQKVAAECGSTSGGGTAYYCSDVRGACQAGVLAYTAQSENLMAYCPLYFEMPPLASRCREQDQATTNLHEMTHLTQIKGTEDFGGYGYNFIQSLSAEQNLNHADTYAVFANAIALGC
ncbi:hypothetical protein PWT90_07729 [Aphanocladium album]|nr:hypothetical protein PWT90_07729 [Aphanocladium album]